jgi:hypothetical protein
VLVRGPNRRHEAFERASGRELFEMGHRFREESTTSAEGRANDSGPDVDASSPPALTIKQRGANPLVSGLQRNLVGWRPPHRRDSEASVAERTSDDASVGVGRSGRGRLERSVGVLATARPGSTRDGGAGPPS